MDEKAWNKGVAALLAFREREGHCAVPRFHKENGCCAADRTCAADRRDAACRCGEGYAATDPAAQAQVAALRQELQKLGWEEGRNIRIDVRFSAADAGRVRAAVMELMSFTPDVLVSNTNLVTAVVQAEVRTIPIVFIFVGDPIGSGFVSDDARPNGNLTGSPIGTRRR